MSDSPTSTAVVKPARKPRKPKPKFDPEKDAQQRRRVYDRSDFYRSMVHLRRICEKLRATLAEFGGYSQDDLVADWLAAKLPMPDPDATEDRYTRFIDGLLDTVDYGAETGRGFLWNVESFLSVLNGLTCGER